jgi:hypothetical protein
VEDGNYDLLHLGRKKWAGVAPRHHRHLAARGREHLGQGKADVVGRTNEQYVHAVHLKLIVPAQPGYYAQVFTYQVD